VLCTGSEWNYVILSTVRSKEPAFFDGMKPEHGAQRTREWAEWCNRTLGIITDKHQINVAITRAKLGLVIIG